MTLLGCLHSIACSLCLYNILNTCDTMPSVEWCEKNQSLKMSTAKVDTSLARQRSDGNDEATETTISIKVYDSLICELRCPSCALPMEPPIQLCETGHSVCNRCTKMLAKCPLCAKFFTETRSLTVEALSAKAQFRCSNASLGCPVRLHLNLLQKHEDRCDYQLGDCFMGKVWGGCKWHGRECDWIDHCELEHREKVFFGAEVTRTWEFKRDCAPKSICGYFIFRVFGQTFNLYQIYDKPKNKIYWTMVYASKEQHVAKRYSFEIELFSPSDETKINVQRNKCHGDRDADILQEGHCVDYGLGDIMRFMDENRILHYRIRVIENSQSKQSSPKILSVLATNDAKSRFFQTDFTQTNIEGNNYKQIPSEKIITRSTSSSNGGSLKETPKNSSNPSPKPSPCSRESPKSTQKGSPIAGLKNIFRSSSTSLFKPIKIGSHKTLSISSTSPSSQPIPPSPKNLPLTSKTWERITKTDSIDKDIIENGDLKKIFVRSYHIEVSKIDDFLNKSTVSLNRANSINSVPKPPRMSLDLKKENRSEMQSLLNNDNAVDLPPPPTSPVPIINNDSQLIINQAK